MEPVPPPLTSESIDSLFALLADAGAVGLRKVSARMEAAETDEAVERMARSLQTVGRYVRQTLALKLRFDREQRQLAAEQRRVAEGELKETQRVREVAVGRRRTKVREHFEGVLWDEYESDEAEELLDGVDHQLDDLVADDPDFLDIPVETLIARLSDKLGLLDKGDAPEDGDGDGDGDGKTQDEAPEAAAPPAPAPVVNAPRFEADWGDPSPRRDRPPPEPPPPDPPP